MTLHRCQGTHRQAKGYPSRGPAPLQRPNPGGWFRKLRERGEAPALPPGLLRYYAAQWASWLNVPVGRRLLIRQYTAEEETMPGDPKECREHARRYAPLAKAATTPEARDQLL